MWSVVKPKRLISPPQLLKHCAHLHNLLFGKNLPKHIGLNSFLILVYIVVTCSGEHTYKL